MKYRLRTLLIVVAVLPPLAWLGYLFWMAVVAPTIWSLMFGEPPPVILKKTEATSAEYIWRDADGKLHVGVDDLPNP